ncbi:MAG TPA: hypothetical protein VEZ90_17930 [Blastocatellia bacterium]|nr:hypothetical protein [Blastocatellia bacterium]
MKDPRLESISAEIFDALEPDQCLTATGGNTIRRTIDITHVGGHRDVHGDIRAD